MNLSFVHPYTTSEYTVHTDHEAIYFFLKGLLCVLSQILDINSQVLKAVTYPQTHTDHCPPELLHDLLAWEHLEHLTGLAVANHFAVGGTSRHH